MCGLLVSVRAAVLDRDCSVIPNYSGTMGTKDPGWLQLQYRRLYDMTAVVIQYRVTRVYIKNESTAVYE